MREADMWVIRCCKDYNLVSVVLEINRGGANIVSKILCQ